MKKSLYAFILLAFNGSFAVADNWMSRLPDGLYVSQVSIPGTHDSATGDGFSGMGKLLGPSYARTQDASIAEQWASGIRAFDLRPCTTSDGYLNINHGIIATSVRFDNALCQIRDSLIANPTEFVVIHIRHEEEGDEDGYDYASLLLEVLGRADLKDYFADFSRDLTVGDLRGKMLLTSRDAYADAPVGAFIENWSSNINWTSQTNGRLVGAGSDAAATASLYMQDFYDSSADGAVEQKVAAVKKLLAYTASHVTKLASSILWAYNFTSAYCQTASVLGYKVSKSDGYRENASYTNAAVIEYLQNNAAGPAGIIMMDYAGVNESDGYATRGQELTDTLISNNFKFITRVNEEMNAAFTEDIEALYTQLAEAREKLSADCPDVAADFESRASAIEAAIDSLKTDLAGRYAAFSLFQYSEMDVSEVKNSIEQLLKEAAAAQAEHDEAVGISPVTLASDSKIRGVYSLGGELLDNPPRGTVCVIRYADDTTRKVRIE